MSTGKQLRYEYTGEYFKPTADGPSFGGGHWNGETVVWVKKDWTVFKLSGREEYIKFQVEDKKIKLISIKT